MLFIAAALADDLSLVVRWSRAEAPLTLHLHQVEAGRLPSVTLPGTAGEALRIDLTLSAESGAAPVTYDLKLYEVETRRNGWERATLVSQPRIIAARGVPAQVSLGAKVPSASGARTDEISVELAYGDLAVE